MVIHKINEKSHPENCTALITFVCSLNTNNIMVCSHSALQQY